MIDIYENKLDECSLTFEEYKKQYTESIQNPEKFWSDKAKSLDWITPFKKLLTITSKSMHLLDGLMGAL